MQQTHPPPTEVNALIALYNARRYAEAESRARALLGQYPNFGFGWKLLGGALQMQGKDALPAFQKTAQLHPEDAETHYNLGVILKSSGRLDDAVASYRRAVKIKPDFAEAHSNLGNTLKELGQLNDAVTSYRRALKIKPDSADAHNNLGTALKALGQLNDAVASYRHAVSLKPDFSLAYYNLGNAQKDLGQLNEAVASYRQAVKIKPDFAEAHDNLGTVLQALGQLDSALASYRNAVEIKPDFAEVHSKIGCALKELGQFAGAVASCRRVVELKPEFAVAHYNLGIALKDIGQSEAALASYRRALEIEPDFADAHLNLGNFLRELGRFDDAVASYRRALEIKPDYADAHNNLGITLKDIGQLDEALTSYRRALEYKSDFTDAQTNLLFTLNYTAHTPEYCLKEALIYGRMVGKKVTSQFSNWQCADKPACLRVGLVSGNLRNHPEGYFLENLLAQLNFAHIELIAYPTSAKADKLTARIKPHFAAWRPLFDLSDEAAASLIHTDGVHVLLDLSGHAGKTRLPIFAWKPAPVQASWLGYFATTGVAEMDYFLADEIGVPEAQRKDFSEAVWYLPDTRLCFTIPDVELPVAALPSLKNGHITFGCFQNLTKVGDEVLTSWGKILNALPSAKLRMQCLQLKDPTVVARFVDRLQQHGIDLGQVTMHGAVSREAYLGAHAEIDMILDTFPYPGGTTTCEALWMGVPTLTLAGDTLLARQGASMLAAAGLQDWVANSVTEYIDKAVTVAGDLPKLAALRAGLREQVSASPLFDAPRFARNFEAALWGMWQTWCDKQQKGKA